MDLALEAWVSGLIELGKLRNAGSPPRKWTPDRPLRLLFVGYNGARNTGADVRVEEMLRQVRQVLGPQRVELTVATQDQRLTQGYFGDARQVKLPDVFPPFLAREVPQYDGVVACEGSMFKSKFADALTVLMVGALGLASAYGKLSLGYGGEAGHMNRLPRLMTSRYCRKSHVITRSEDSLDLLRELGIPVELGTDTAWTFEPHGPEYGEAKLREAGWNGRPILVVCPINPFWWPVKPSLAKSCARALGGQKDSHYRSVYFHKAGPEVDKAYDRYLNAIIGAVGDFRRRTDVFPILMAMERLDSRACQRVSERLGGVPIFSSNDYDMYELVSIARRADWMISSRYHGIVTTMPAGVVSAGVTMDERIRSLMSQRRQEHLCLEVDDPELEGRLGAVLDTLRDEAETIRRGIGETVVTHLKMMGRMGARVEDYVRRCYPDFPAREGDGSWEAYLPPLSPELQALVARHPSS